MIILLTGANGQVGRALARVIPADVTLRPFTRDTLDITDARRVEHVVGTHGGPDTVLINLAAYTDVDGSETDRACAYRVNADGVALLASACAAVRVPMIHVSTDYVFGASARATCSEDDTPDPINTYGESKLAGENHLRSLLTQHLVVRTSWVFGPDCRNFARTMLRLAAQQDEVRVVSDEVSCPTPAADLANALLVLARRAGSTDFAGWGTYHFCGRPAVSRAEFARAIFDEARAFRGLPTARVREIPSADFKAAARRPHRSVLACSRIQKVFGVDQPEWRPGLRTMLASLAERGT